MNLMGIFLRTFNLLRGLKYPIFKIENIVYVQNYILIFCQVLLILGFFVQCKHNLKPLKKLRIHE